MLKIYLDPRTKLVVSFSLSLLAVIFNQPLQLIYLLAFTVLFTGCFGVNLWKTVSRFRVFLPLLLMMFVVQSVFSPSGTVIFQVGSLPFLTTGGIALGVSVLLRMVVLLSTALFLMTSPSRDIILGLIQWKVPYEIAFMATMGLGFIPLFREEVKDALIAAQLRGREIKKGSFHERYGLISTIFFPIVYGVLVKAQKMTIAMEARGFRAYKTRTYLRRLTLRQEDYFIISFFLLSTVAIILGKIFLGGWG